MVTRFKTITIQCIDLIKLTEEKNIFSILVRDDLSCVTITVFFCRPIYLFIFKF